VLVCATDGCFGYVPTPMHFEQLLLDPLMAAPNVTGWSSAVQSRISAVTGDDAAMSVMAVGADFRELKDLYADRVAELEREYTAPIDELDQAVRRAEQELQQLRQRQLDDTQRLWARYQPEYEHYLHTSFESDPDDTAPDDPAPDPDVTEDVPVEETS
jgi:hypothetical protein